jgi:hypothetical protein
LVNLPQKTLSFVVAQPLGDMTSSTVPQLPVRGKRIRWFSWRLVLVPVLVLVPL